MLESVKIKNGGREGVRTDERDPEVLLGCDAFVLGQIQDVHRGHVSPSDINRRMGCVKDPEEGRNHSQSF